MSGQGARAKTKLLPPAVHQGLQTQMAPIANDQTPYPFGAMKLVRRQRQQINGDLLQVDGEFSSRLGGNKDTLVPSTVPR